MFERPPAQFKPPPPPAKTTKIEPRKLQHKIKIREQQQNSGRPRVSPRLTANRVSGISLPEIEVDPDGGAGEDEYSKEYRQEFLRDRPRNWLRDRNRRSRTRTRQRRPSPSLVLKGSGERIAFIVDLSRSMVEDDKGGLNGINVLKTELKKMVEKLNDGTFFNLIFFDDNVDIFKPQLVIAKQRLEEGSRHDSSLRTTPNSVRNSFRTTRKTNRELALGDPPAQL